MCVCVHVRVSVCVCVMKKYLTVSCFCSSRSCCSYVRCCVWHQIHISVYQKWYCLELLEPSLAWRIVTHGFSCCNLTCHIWLVIAKCCHSMGHAVNVHTVIVNDVVSDNISFIWLKYCLGVLQFLCRTENTLFSLLFRLFLSSSIWSKLGVCCNFPSCLWHSLLWPIM